MHVTLFSVEPPALGVSENICCVSTVRARRCIVCSHCVHLANMCKAVTTTETASIISVNVMYSEHVDITLFAHVTPNEELMRSNTLIKPVVPILFPTI